MKRPPLNADNGHEKTCENSDSRRLCIFITYCMTVDHCPLLATGLLYEYEADSFYGL